MSESFSFHANHNGRADGSPEIETAGHPQMQLVPRVIHSLNDEE
jgi:hypothetical protein